MSIINICINNVNREYYLEEGSSGIVLENIVKDIENEYKGYITLANINNKLRELSYKVKEDCNIKFIDTTNADGSRVYSRTMSFIFIMACNELFDKARVTIEHSLSRGLYCEVHTNTKLQDFDLKNIKNKMQDIIDKNYKIEKIDFREKSKANDDGYRGIHIYFMNNPKSFRIEIQIWSKVDAILNFYTHQNIYKVNGDISYALSLRKWIDELPQNEGFKFENYIWEIINNPSKYREKVADILVKNIEENKSLEMTLLEHYMYITNLNIQSKYIIDLKSHLENIPINIEGIETTFSEYIIRRVIEVVEEVV